MGGGSLHVGSCGAHVLQPWPHGTKAHGSKGGQLAAPPGTQAPFASQAVPGGGGGQPPSDRGSHGLQGAPHLPVGQGSNGGGGGESPPRIASSPVHPARMTNVTRSKRERSPEIMARWVPGLRGRSPS